MGQPIVKTENKNTLWEARLRFKVGETCVYNGVYYTNVTGKNSEPGTSIDWLKGNRQIAIEKTSDIPINDGNDGVHPYIDTLEGQAIRDFAEEIADGRKFKQSARVATTGNIVLSGLQIVDTISLVEDDDAVVWMQTNPAENGKYKVKSGAWVRTSDANTAAELVSATISVEEGAEYADKTFYCTNNSGFILGTDPVNFITVSNAISHNETTGKQGGTAGEFFHLTQSGHDKAEALPEGEVETTTGAQQKADAKVEDQIVDGVIDKAPSQNAVFDKFATHNHDDRYAYKVLYSYPNGALIKTDIPSTTPAFFNFTLRGNTYNTGNNFFIVLQGYNNPGGNNIINISSTSLGHNPEIKVFNYEGFLCIHFGQSNTGQSVLAYCEQTNTTYQGNRITSITNAAFPTTGVTRLVTSTPKTFANSAQGALADNSIQYGTKGTSIGSGFITPEFTFEGAVTGSFDNILSPGWYFVGNTSTETPIGTGGIWYLNVLRYANTNICQLAYTYGAGNGAGVHYRTKFQGDWSTWRELADTDQTATSAQGALADTAVQRAGDTMTGRLNVENNFNQVVHIIQKTVSLSSGFYTLFVDSSSHNSNLTQAGAFAVDVFSGRAFTINGFGNVAIGTNMPEAKFHVVGNIKATGSVQIGDNLDLPSVNNKGAKRYWEDANNSYEDTVMKTEAGTYEWVNVVTNAWT